MTKESLLAQVMTPIVSARTMKVIVTKDEVGEISKYIRSQIYYTEQSTIIIRWYRYAIISGTASMTRRHHSGRVVRQPSSTGVINITGYWSKISITNNCYNIKNLSSGTYRWLIDFLKHELAAMILWLKTVCNNTKSWYYTFVLSQKTESLTSLVADKRKLYV